MKAGERRQGTGAGCAPRAAGMERTVWSATGPRDHGPRDHGPRTTTAAPAFTLLEMIGSLAVLALIASALFPLVIRQIDRAAKTAETQNMQAISSNFLAYVRGTVTIPSSAASSWGAAVAAYMNQPISSITNNARGVTRLCLYDTSGWLGSNATYPTNQTASGFSFTPGTPGLARLLIVSSIDAKNGVPGLAQADFQATWNWDPAVNATLPTTTGWTGWKGNGYDVVIQRISLDNLFHRIMLSSTNNSFSYSINGALGAATRKFDSYFIDGSVLGLYTSANAVQTTELILSDFSRFYLGTQWNDAPGPGPPNQTSISLDNLAALFAGSPAATQDPRGDNTFGAAGGLIAYMTAYASWAAMSPCFSYGGGGNNSLSAQYNTINTVIQCFQTGNGGGKGSGSTSGCEIVPLK